MTDYLSSEKFFPNYEETLQAEQISSFDMSARSAESRDDLRRSLPADVAKAKKAAMMANKKYLVLVVKNMRLQSLAEEDKEIIEDERKARVIAGAQREDNVHHRNNSRKRKREALMAYEIERNAKKTEPAIPLGRTTH